jgi:hypothetical protein
MCVMCAMCAMLAIDTRRLYDVFTKCMKCTKCTKCTLCATYKFFNKKNVFFDNLIKKQRNNLILLLSDIVQCFSLV